MLFQSCASLSKSKNACRSVAESQVIIQGKIGEYFFGNIFQIGDCAISETLRVETGEFINNRKGAIRTELNFEGYPIKESLMIVFDLFGCRPGYNNDYIDFTRKEFAYIFEEESKMSGRQMMLFVRKKLKEDSVMRELCFQ